MLALELTYCNTLLLAIVAINTNTIVRIPERGCVFQEVDVAKSFATTQLQQYSFVAVADLLEREAVRT